MSTTLDDRPDEHDPDEHDPEYDVLDEEWLATPGKRSRVRPVLLGVLVAASVFLAGVWVQQEFGTADASGTASPFGAGGLPDGIPEGFPDLAGGGGFPGAGAATGAGGGEAGDAADSADAPDVIGTLVAIRGDTWIVEDLGGTRRRVTVTPESSITQELQVDAATVETGAALTVSGETNETGELTATEITARPDQGATERNTP